MKEADGLSSPAVLSLVGHIPAYNQGGPWLDALRGCLADNLALVDERLRAAFPQLGWEPPQAG
jgi:cystathionine beta-lyase